MTERDKGVLEVLWKEPEMKVRGESVTPLTPEGCQSLGETLKSYEGNGIIKKYKLSCRGELAGKTIEVQGLNKSNKNVLLHVTLKDKRSVQVILNSKKNKFMIPKTFSSWDFLKDT